MIGTRIRKIFGDVQARMGRTMLVSSAIFVGVMGTVAMFSASEILNEQLNENIQQSKIAMLEVSVTSTANMQSSNDVSLSTLQQVDGVTDLQGEIQTTAQFKLHLDDDRFVNGFINAFSAPYDPALPLKPLRLLEGSYPKPDSAEIVIDRRMADAYDLVLGDTIYLRVVSPSAQMESPGDIGTLEARTISGFVFNSYQNPITGASAEESIYMALNDARYISGIQNYTDIAVRFEDFATAETQVNTFLDVLTAETAFTATTWRMENPAEAMILTRVNTFGQTLRTLALVALIVSGFLVVNVITSIVVEQKQQIGAMKAIGATRFDNIVIYSGIAFAYGVLGVVPGAILGIPLGYLLVDTLAPMMNVFLNGFEISPLSIGIGIVVGLAVPVAAAFIPVMNGTRVSIVEAMTDFGISPEYKQGPVSRFVAQLPLPITIRQGLSNALRKKARLAFTVLTLAVAAGAFMGIFATYNSITDILGASYDILNVELAIVPVESREPTAFMTLLEENFGDQAAAIEPGFNTQVQFEGVELATSNLPDQNAGVVAYGYDVTSPTPPFNLDLIQGDGIEADSKDSTIIVASKLADKAGWHIGDTVTMQLPGSTLDMTIVGIADFHQYQVWLSWETLANAVHFMAGTSSTPPLAMPNDQEILPGTDPETSPVPQLYFIDAKLSDPSPEEVDRIATNINDRLLELGIPVQVINYIELTEQQSESMTTIVFILQAVAGLIGLVGALGLLTVLSISVYERQKEIGVMRSVGASSSTIVSMFLTEGLSVGFVAWIAGLPIGYLILLVMLNTTEMDNLVEAVFPITAGVLGLISMMVITIVASLWPSLAASRKTVSDILRYQ